MFLRMLCIVDHLLLKSPTKDGFRRYRDSATTYTVDDTTATAWLKPGVGDQTREEKRTEDPLG